MSTKRLYVDAQFVIENPRAMSMPRSLKGKIGTFLYYEGGRETFWFKIPKEGSWMGADECFDKGYLRLLDPDLTAKSA